MANSNPEHIKLDDYLNQIWGIMAILKALQDLTSMCFTPELQLQKQLNQTKCLVDFLPDIVPDTQNRALKKWKLDSNPRYDPD